MISRTSWFERNTGAALGCVHFVHVRKAFFRAKCAADTQTPLTTELEGSKLSKTGKMRP
jgi:hypothetical protein